MNKPLEVGLDIIFGHDGEGSKYEQFVPEPSLDDVCAIAEIEKKECRAGFYTVVNGYKFLLDNEDMDVCADIYLPDGRRIYFCNEHGVVWWGAGVWCKEINDIITSYKKGTFFQQYKRTRQGEYVSVDIKLPVFSSQTTSNLFEKKLQSEDESDQGNRFMRYVLVGLAGIWLGATLFYLFSM